ncbi:Protein of unknown function, partial [Gryllus bimaculatus]
MYYIVRKAVTYDEEILSSNKRK